MEAKVIQMHEMIQMLGIMQRNWLTVRQTPTETEATEMIQKYILKMIRNEDFRTYLKMDPKMNYTEDRRQILVIAMRMRL